MTNDSYFISINSQELSAVDPWLPRIQNNDEYLQLGLTFAPSTNDVNNDVNDTDFTPLGDVGVLRLAHALQYNTRLLSLDLSGNTIGALAAAALAKALYRRPDNISCQEFGSRTALQYLNLSNNKIGDEGAKAIAEALMYNTSLRSLDLSHNGISVKGVLDLLDDDPFSDSRLCVRKLHLTGNINNVSRKEMSLIVAKVCNVIYNGQLQVLTIHDCSNITKHNDGFRGGGASDEDIWKMLQSFYALPSNTYSRTSRCNLSKRNKVQNHRLQKLTLPNCTAKAKNVSTTMKTVRFQLNKILQFNAFYEPILNLNEHLASQPSNTKYYDSSLPNYLQRDVHSGALIGLLSPANKRDNSVGIRYKEMPHLIAFAVREFNLDTLWNLLRYRSDVFRYAGKFRTKGDPFATCRSCVVL